MPDKLLLERLSRLRKLRQKTRELNGSFVKDHRPFLQQGSECFYFRKPSGEKDSAPSVTPTLTAWMAKCCNGHSFKSIEENYDKFVKDNPEAEEEDKPVKNVKEAYQKLLNEPWDTGGLLLNNPFTAAVFARAAGFLVESNQLPPAFIRETVKTTKSPEEGKGKWIVECEDSDMSTIVSAFLKDPESNILIKPFPASPTIAYWFIEAADMLNVDISDSIQTVAKWAASEYRRQHSLVAAGHQSLMDPVAMVMAASVCKRIKRIAESHARYETKLDDCLFPSAFELEAGVKAFFESQNEESGVWEKYFPIFHYPKSGPNHCWHFEVLEAVIGEFSNLLVLDDIIDRLFKSLDWLKNHRLKFQADEKEFCGWNGGGDVEAMRRGEPESWPTSIAHMFLAKMDKALSVEINATILEKYSDRVQSSPADKDVSEKAEKGKKWTQYLDSKFEESVIANLGEDKGTVKSLVEKEMLDSIGDVEQITPEFKFDGKRSAVLFGPPGTAKTSLCEAIARRKGLYLLELSPSDFLSGGLEGIYNKVDEVFEDLLDLYGVVILFDEMDALVQNRDGAVGSGNVQKLDVTETLLTTSMLPKLTKLHKAKKSMFFMATNYFGTFDKAITRAGRFDLLVHMAPPSSEHKIKGLRNWCRDEEEDPIRKAKLKLKKIGDAEQEFFDLFDRFTYGETSSLFEAIQSHRKFDGSKKKTAAAINGLEEQEILTVIKRWAGVDEEDGIITLSEGSDTLEDFKKDRKLTKIQG